MAKIENVEPYPPAIGSLIQAKLAENQQRYKQRSWLRRQLFIEIEEPGRYVADVRWLSECDTASRTCAGYLLGRWIMHSEGSQPLEIDFEPYEVDPDAVAAAFDRLLHVMVYDFALSAEGDTCVLVEIDLDGGVQRAVYELPHGVNSASLGPMIGDVVREKFARNRGDACVPAGWRPRPTDAQDDEPATPGR